MSDRVAPTVHGRAFDAYTVPNAKPTRPTYRQSILEFDVSIRTIYRLVISQRNSDDAEDLKSRGRRGEGRARAREQEKKIRKHKSFDEPFCALGLAGLDLERECFGKSGVTIALDDVRCVAQNENGESVDSE